MMILSLYQFKVINTLLYQREEYCFTCEQTINLFEDILKRFEKKTYPVSECLDGINQNYDKLFQLKQCHDRFLSRSR